MYIVAGLGNPGKQYQYTRHNVGFVAVDYLAASFGVQIKKIKFKGLYGVCDIENEKVVFLKPSTYMNLSGESVREAAEYYKVPPENIIIIYDDVDIPVGRLRIRKSGSAGGHNGIKSIIYQLGTENFPRVRIGTGKGDEPLIERVLAEFSKKEGESVTKCIKYTDRIVSTIISEGTESAMNKYNGLDFGNEG